MKYISSNIAKIIKSLCKDKQVTVKEMLNNVGLAYNTMSNLKSSMPKADNLAKIADYLGVSVDYLLGRTNTPTIETNFSEDEYELVLGYRELLPDTQKEVVDFVRFKKNN